MESIEAFCHRVEVLYAEYQAAPFPEECLDNELVNGTSLMLLDANIAGCVSTFAQSDYTLDLWRTAVLGLCYRRIALVFPHLPDEGKPYYARLETMAGIVLQVVARKAQGVDDR